MQKRKRISILAASALAAVLAVWVLLPVLLPGLTLTQRPPEFVEPVPDLAQPSSHLSLPLEFSLAELERRLTLEVDQSLARGREKNRDFQAWRTGPVRLRSKGTVVTLTLPLAFKSKAGPDTKGALVVTTRLSADIDRDWKPRVLVRSTYDWTKKPKIRLLFIKMRVSSVVGRSIQKKLRELDDDLRRRIESALNLQPRAETWWASLREPELLSEQPPIWLSVIPQALYFAPLSGDGRQIGMTIGIRARLATFVGNEPAVTPARPLPALDRATPQDHGFALHLPVVADYRGLTERLREALAGREIALDRGAITPTDFQLYTSGRNLVVGIEFRGDAPGFWLDTRGTIYFTGEPRFNAQTRVLSIENFQFARRLNNPLVSTATWVFQDSLRDRVRERLVWDLDERLREGARDLTEQINKPLDDGLKLSGEVEHLNLTGIHCQADGIRIGLEVRGQLKLTLAEGGSALPE